MSTATQTTEAKSLPLNLNLPVVDARIAIMNDMEVEALVHQYQRQYPSQAPTAEHLCYTMAYATLRQRKIEEAQLTLLDTMLITDPIHARIERLRGAAERSFFRALKELQALLRNEPKSASEPEPAIPVNETKPIRPTMEELRKLHPNTDRNQLARMRANWKQ